MAEDRRRTDSCSSASANATASSSSAAAAAAAAAAASRSAAFKSVPACFDPLALAPDVSFALSFSQLLPGAALAGFRALAAASLIFFPLAIDELRNCLGLWSWQVPDL